MLTYKFWRLILIAWIGLWFVYIYFLEGSLHWIFYAGIAVCVAAFVCGSLYLSFQFYGKSFHRLPGKMDIAISFDDGPHPEFTPRVLDILKDQQTSATFFCIGEKANQHPEIIKRIIDEGHVLGNHGFYHRWWFPLQTMANITSELKKANEAILNNSKLFRPPFGVNNPMIAKAANVLGMQIWGWTIKSWDTVSENSDKLLHYLLGRCKGGDVILLHDTKAVSVNMLKDLILGLKKKGFNMVVLTELNTSQ